MPVPKQLTQIAIFRTGYPNPRKVIFHHQLQQQLRIFAVGLLLFDALRLYLRWITDPHFETQLCEQSLEPAGISGRLHPHAHVDSSQLQVSIELLGFPITVVQSSFAIFASLFQQKCNLLKARVIIYAYHHVRLLPPEPLVVKQPKSTRVEGADIVYAIKWFWIDFQLSGKRVNQDLTTNKQSLSILLKDFRCALPMGCADDQSVAHARCVLPFFTW